MISADEPLHSRQLLECVCLSAALVSSFPPHPPYPSQHEVLATRRSSPSSTFFHLLPPFRENPGIFQCRRADFKSALSPISSLRLV
jgi:hypothetical protein